VYREVIDVKAMRTIRPDREVQWVVENTSLAGALSVNISIAARFLLGT